MNAPRHNRLYWTLQLLGWTSFELIGLAINSVFTAFSIDLIGLAAAELVVLIFVSHRLRCHAKKREWTSLAISQLAPRLALATFIAALFTKSITALLLVFATSMLENQSFSWLYFGVIVFQTQIIFILWSLLYFSIHYFRNYKQQEVEKWRLQAGIKEAELIALKAQVNPHFLFNCLNNIRALVLEDPEKSRDAITRLSDLLRFSIKQSSKTSTPLQKEIEMVEDYLALEAIHMEERLQYSITVPDQLETVNIPPMSLQLLVENAIQHGISRLPQGGRIEISITSASDSLSIEVANTGTLSPSPSRSTGIGLKNIRERLDILYGGEATLDLRATDEGMVIATLALPLRPTATATPP